MGLFNRKTDDEKFNEAFERGLSFYNEDMYDEALEEFHKAEEILTKVRFVDINRRYVMYAIMGELHFIKGCQIKEIQTQNGTQSFLLSKGGDEEKFVDPVQSNFMRSLEYYEEAKDEKFNLLETGTAGRIALLHNMAKVLEKTSKNQEVSLSSYEPPTRIDEAIKYLEEAVELNPTVSSLFELAVMTHNHRFDFEECIKRYDEIISKGPNSDWAKHSWNNKGVIYDTMNDTEQANMCYTNAKEFDSSNRDANSDRFESNEIVPNVIDFTSDSLAKSKKWLRHWNEKEEPLPEDIPKIEFNRGVMMFYAGGFVPAKDHFKNVLKFDPDDKEANEFYTKCLEEISKTLF